MSSSVESWPDYMQEVHHAWLNDLTDWSGGASARTPDFSIDADISAVRSNNPYEDVLAYDPSDRVSIIEDYLDYYYNIITAINPDNDWATALSLAMTRAAVQIQRPNPLPTFERISIGEVDVPSIEVIEVDADIDEAVEAFDTEQAPEFMRSVARFSASMADINAVQGHSGFMLGLAFMEKGYYDKVAGMRKELRTVAAQKKMDVKAQGASQEQQMQYSANKEKRDLEYSEANAYRQGIQKVAAFEIQTDISVEGANAQIENSSVEQAMASILTLRTNRRSMLDNATRLASEVQKMGMVAEKEQHDGDIMFTAKDVLWELDLYQYGANLLAAQSGGVTQTGAMTGTQSLIADVANWANAIGTVLDVTGIGGGTEGVLNWIFPRNGSGWFDNDSSGNI